MKKFQFSLFLVLFTVMFLSGCGKENRYDPTAGKRLISEINSLLQSDPDIRASSLPPLAVKQAEMLKDIKGALETMESAESACADIENVQSRINAYSTLAQSYARIGVKPKAMEMLKKAEDAIGNLPENVPSDEKIAMSLDLAKAYVALDIESGANSALLAAMDEVGEVENDAIKVELYLNIAGCYAEVGMAAGVESVAEMLDPLAENAETKRDQTSIYTRLAGAFVAAKATADADRYLKLALETLEEIESPARQAMSLCEIAMVKNQAGDKDGAKNLVKDAQKRYVKEKDSTTRQLADDEIVKAKTALGM